MPHHAPDLPRQLDGRCLAVGAGHGDHGLREGREIAGGKAGEQPARLLRLDVDRALDLRLRPSHDRHRAGSHGGGDEVLTIHARALEGAEHGARRDLAIINGEARDHRIQRGIDEARRER